MAAKMKILVVMAVCVFTVSSSPIEDYVNKPDKHYKYEPLTQIRMENYTVHILNMTSQKWMDEQFSNRPIWWHYVCVIVPDKIKVKDTAFLLIGQGHNTDKSPDLRDMWIDLVTVTAVSTQSVAVVLMQVPNQRIAFQSDPTHRHRSEDSLVAWTWKLFMDNPDNPEVLLHFPMTKAVVRAMDTVDDYSQKIRGQAINKYFITGASKRGWATWLTAAVDKRIIGMAPVVFDLLSMKKALHHHYRSLGGWTFAFKEYHEVNITEKLTTPVFQKLCSVMDPLVYKDRYKMPTFIIKASGDEFFLLDETRFFYNNLTGPRFLRVLPNCEHTTIPQTANLYLSLRSFYLHVIHGAKFPQVTWTMTSGKTGGSIRVKTDRDPLSVTVYQAKTLRDGRRDFRLISRDPIHGGEQLHPVWWSTGKVTKLNSLEYEATMKRPSKGWGGFFLEVAFKGIENSVLAFSTEVNIIPDTLPFPDCSGMNCTGILV